MHEIAQQTNPDARVVYVDADAIAAPVLVDNSRSAVVHTDLRDIEAVLEHPHTNRLLDFERPIGMLMITVPHIFSDLDDPGMVTAGYRAALAPGSHLVIRHLCEHLHPGRPRRHRADEGKADRKQPGIRGKA